MIKTCQNTSPEPGGDTVRPPTDREAARWKLSQACSGLALHGKWLPAGARPLRLLSAPPMLMAWVSDASSAQSGGSCHERSEGFSRGASVPPPLFSAAAECWLCHRCNFGHDEGHCQSLVTQLRVTEGRAVLFNKSALVYSCFWRGAQQISFISWFLIPLPNSHTLKCFRSLSILRLPKLRGTDCVWPLHLMLPSSQHPG